MDYVTASGAASEATQSLPGRRLLRQKIAAEYSGPPRNDSGIVNHN